jgi:glutamyl-tRNA reductase
VKILCAGVNHETAPLDVRQCLAFDRPATERALAALRGRFPTGEFVILSTCNRVEVYCAAPAEGPPQCDDLLSELAAFHGVEVPGLQGHAYGLDTARAVEHLFLVASSLDSMVIGESQILGQVKTAFLWASEAGATGKYLNRLFHQALHAAKRVHAATEIGRRRTSVASVAVDFASRIFSGLEAKRVLVIGAGETAERAATHLRSTGCRQITVVNRAAELAARDGGAAMPWSELDAALAASDIVITSTASDRPPLTRERMAAVHKRRRWANWLILDLAVPRDVEPAAGQLDNVYLYDMDALGRVVSENLSLRQGEVDTATSIVTDEVQAYLDWLEAREVGPLVEQLEARLHDLGDEEYARLMRRLPDDLPESARNEIRLATHRIVHKLLHEPIKELKRDARRDRGRVAMRLLRRLFGLDDRGDDAG